jgi:hypothetical protein
VNGLGDELMALVEDADRVSIDVTLKREAGVIDAAFALDFRSASSWTVQTVRDTAQRSSGPPEMFFKLPADANTATWGVPANPKRYDGIRRTLAELLDGFLSHEKVPRRARDQMVDLVEETRTTAAASVYAQGDLGDPPPVRKRSAKPCAAASAGT